MSKPIYRIALISGLWRLMKDNKLHSTYSTQAAANAGMATEQNRDEARAMKAEVIPPMDMIIALEIIRAWVTETRYKDHSAEAGAKVRRALAYIEGDLP